MTTIGIQNPKLIVTNDYQQFLAHFEWFLSQCCVTKNFTTFTVGGMEYRTYHIFLFSDPYLT